MGHSELVKIAKLNFLNHVKSYVSQLRLNEITQRKLVRDGGKMNEKTVRECKKIETRTGAHLPAEKHLVREHHSNCDGIMLCGCFDSGGTGPIHKNVAS